LRSPVITVKARSFRDGADLITPQLERTIDEIARSFDGFLLRPLRRALPRRRSLPDGKDVTVHRLNGVTSESTNLYGPILVDPPRLSHAVRAVGHPVSRSARPTADAVFDLRRLERLSSAPSFNT
jgi:hypothetical protein